MLTASDKRFICIDDITGVPTALNTVIYNPLLSKERNEQILYEACKTQLWVTLTPDQLDELTSIPKDNLNLFVERLREIIYKK